MTVEFRQLAVAVASLCAGVAFGAYEDVTCERFPDADVVTLEEVEKVKYNPDGTYESNEETWAKLMTEKGRRDESTQTISYSKRYSEAVITYVGVVGKDGKEREIDVSETTKESTDNADMSSNIYDPLDRKIVCTVPGLKIGDVLHTKVRRKCFQSRTGNQWSDLSIMEWSQPILKSTYEVTAPAALPLKKMVVRHPLGNVTKTERKLDDGSMVYVFTATNSPQAFPEPDMPPLYTQVQNVRVSTAANWQEISRWYWDVCKPHLQKTNAAMTNKVNELRELNGVDPLRAIFRFVSQEIRYMGLTMEDKSPGYAPHDVDVTFDNRYGVCRDKAGLLVAMLRLAGYKAFPVLIHVGAKLDPEVPQPFFNHAIVAIENGAGDEKYTLMDPTNENTKDIFPSYLSNCSYLVARPEGEELRTSPVPSPAHNTMSVKTRGWISKEGSLLVENQLDFGGVNDTVYRNVFARRTPEDRVKTFERIVKTMSPGAELIKCEIEPADMSDTESPIKVHIASRLPETVLRGKTRDELNVSFVSKSLGLVNFLLGGSTSLEKRRFPLALDTTAKVEETIDIDIGEALGEVVEMPPDLKIDGGYDYSRKMSIAGTHLKARRELAIAAVEFSPEEYLRLREDIKRVEAAERKRPLFAVDELRDADVKYWLDSSETTIFSDREWVTTNVFVKEILTYQGKRQSAELKFSYNPTWKQVELVSAVVSNRDGSVKSVTAKEMNVMDCGWASSAPRYPAGKMLVVNLPAVEIGSVISVTRVTTVTNAPISFYAEYGFDSKSPVDRRIVRVNDWRREVVKPRRIPDEPSQPVASVWRDLEIVSSNRFETIDMAVGDADPKALTPALKEISIESIRNWMARYVKVTGPDLYEVPLNCQLTDPERVLSERYATRLDYVRTLCALLRGAGYEADVVLAASDADTFPTIRRRIMFDKPNVGAFSSALCRVVESKGGFFGIGAEERTFFVGTENEYTPLGASAYVGSDYFDPESGEFGLVTIPAMDLMAFDDENSHITVRENGAVDMKYSSLKYGPSVGAYRKRFVEMLPEDRSRFYQKLLGEISQAASATEELEVDTEAYPAKTTFACFVPDYAVISGDTLSLTLPSFDCDLPSLTGSARKTPVGIGPADGSRDTVTITFPEGYVEIEHLPENFVFSDPNNITSIWIINRVESKVKDNCLMVKIVRGTLPRISSWFGPERFELLKDWKRIGTSKANRTIIVRKAKQ